MARPRIVCSTFKYQAVADTVWGEHRKKKPIAGASTDAPLGDLASASTLDGLSQPDESSTHSANESANNANGKSGWNSSRNHGRLGHAAYTGCPLVDVPHASLTNGASCPSCAACDTEGKLRIDTPRVIVCLTSGPLIHGTRYALSRYRCAVCGERFEATLPASAQTGKYSASCKSQLAVARYGMGLPFKRIEQWQAYQGVPLADATQ